MSIVNADAQYAQGSFKGFPLTNIVLAGPRNVSGQRSISEGQTRPTPEASAQRSTGSEINAVNNSTTHAGRRGVLHEYPYQDFPFFEDMGRKARKFDMEFHFIGEDHMSVTNQFLNLVETDPAEGFLVHPQRGQHVVVPIEVTATDKESTIGLTVVKAVFIEVGFYRYPDDNPFGNFTRLDINSVIDRIINNAFVSGLPTGPEAQIIEGLNRSRQEIINNFGGASDTELRQIIDGADFQNQPEIRLLALSQQISNLGNPNSILQITNQNDLFEYRERIIQDLTSIFSSSQSVDPGLAQHADDLALTTLINYERYASDLNPLVIRATATSLPSVIAAQELGTSHEEIVRLNNFVDPIFMNTVVNASGFNNQLDRSSEPVLRVNDFGPSATDLPVPMIDTSPAPTFNRPALPNRRPNPMSRARQLPSQIGPGPLPDNRLPTTFVGFVSSFF